MRDFQICISVPLKEQKKTCQTVVIPIGHEKVIFDAGGHWKSNSIIRGYEEVIWTVAVEK